MDMCASAALGLIVFLPLALLQLAAPSINWTERIETELPLQADKVAYCRSLLHPRQPQKLRTSLQHTSCAALVDNQLPVTGELLMDTQPRCWLGWEVFGRRCRKRV